eukprot:m.11562 g.11562  ORF g.11562 m.11562 type:complete len:57 (+) comp4457_c0_seq2:3638-3808(+)
MVTSFSERFGAEMEQTRRRKKSRPARRDRLLVNTGCGGPRCSYALNMEIQVTGASS